MNTQNYYDLELADSLMTLGLRTPVPDFDMDTHPTIFFPYLSGEEVSLATAVLHIMQRR
jgi:hypothetical protein